MKIKKLKLQTLIKQNFKNFTSQSNKTKFPYKFNNPTINSLSNDLHFIFKDEFRKDLAQAYNAFLDILKEKDFDQIREICEKTFAEKTIEALQNIGELNITNGSKTSIIEMVNEYHFFITSNRKLNKEKGIVLEPNFMPAAFKFIPATSKMPLPQIYKGLGAGNPRSVVRILCNVESNKILYLKDKEEPDYAKEKHFILFECEVDEFMDCIAVSNVDFPGFVTKLGKFRDHYEWKIADFDYFLNENKLI